MGNALQSSRPSTSGSTQNPQRSQLGKNKPLKRLPIHWSSQIPLTVEQLQHKRDEFWDTAPAFEGRQEIWNALKSVAEFIEKEDFDMAQAIIDGAGILLPSGTISDCYDELGCRYQLPFYLFSQPSNLIGGDNEDDQPQQPPSSSLPSPTNTSQVSRTTEELGGLASNNNNAVDAPSQRRCSSSSSAASNRPSSSLWTQLCCWCSQRSTAPFASYWSAVGVRRRRRQSSSSDTKKGSDDMGLHPTRSSLLLLSQISPLRVRLSSGQDHLIEIGSLRTTVADAKRQLAARIGCDERDQRWFVCGHALPDRAKLASCHIPPGFVIQAIVHQSTSTTNRPPADCSISPQGTDQSV